uniref:Coleoptericin n=1 Tax=Anatolica polita TaxID=442710 RepID=A0A1P8NW62_9CUCU|nr:coleoptericin [Anatolica polita]
MVKFCLYFAFAALVAAATAVPVEQLIEEYGYHPEELHTVYLPEEEVVAFYRPRRSLQPGAPQFPVPGQSNEGWSGSPNVERDEQGNTRTSINVQHKGNNHDFDAGWSKVIRGPAKAKPSWHVRGTYRW